MENILILNRQNINIELLIDILKKEFNVRLINSLKDIGEYSNNEIIILIDYKKNIQDTPESDICLYFSNESPIKRILNKNFIENKFNSKLLEKIEYFIEIHCDQLKKKFEEKIKYFKKSYEVLQEEKKKIEEENKNFHKELNFASDLQKNLLPKDFPFLDKVNFISKYLPSTYIGGDFFDIAKLDDNRFAVIIIDVSGHGVKSAIIASMIKAIFQKEIKNCERINDFFYKMNLEFQRLIQTDDYLTACLMIIDLEKYTLTYSNAAHPNPVIIREDEIIELKTNGFVIGILNKNFYDQDIIKIHKGDKIFLYTDGIIETVGENNKIFGKDRLINILKQNIFLPIEDIADSIMTELIFFSQKPFFEDDITLFAFEIL